MFRSIVVPLDGSTFAEWALPTALALARRGDGRIEIVTVHQPSPRPLPGGSPEYDAAWESAGYQRCTSYLEEVGDRVRNLSGATVACQVLTGKPADALIRHALARACDLIVMASHGRGGFSRAWLGSTADDVIRHSPLPVLLLRPHETEEPDFGREPEWQRILLPLDGSPDGEHVIAPAAALAGLFDATFLLLRVVRPPFALGSPYMPYSVHVNEGQLERRREEAAAYLAAVAKGLGRQGLASEILVATSSNPAGAILGCTQDRPPDLIALSTHGQGGVRRLVLGSVTDKVVRAVHIPLLLSRPISR